MVDITRRGLIRAGLATSGALVIGVTVGCQGDVDAPSTPRTETSVNAWVKVGSDNRITAILPISEMGQGAQSSVAAMLADEMDVDWSMVDVEQAPASPEYANQFVARGFLGPPLKEPGIVDHAVNEAFLKPAQDLSFQTTGGSMSVRYTGMFGMRAAGAAARDMLMQAAAADWQVPLGELRTDAGYIIHDATDRSAPYSEFVVAAADIRPPTKTRIKSPDEFKYMGKDVPRLDIPSKIGGTAVFGIDVELEGMKYAAVIGPPVLGNTVETVDSSMAQTMPGVVDVLNLETFVAIIGDSYWHAQNAANEVDVKWTTGPANALSQGDVFAQFEAAMRTASDTGNELVDHEVGDLAAARASAERTFEASYKVPFLAHTTMEPMNATAWARDGVCEIWAGMQNPLGSRAAAAAALGLELEQVIMHNVFLGGGFGRRGRPDYTNMAGQIAMQVDYPVQMIFSREQDISQDFYRPAAVSRFKSAIGADGEIQSWENQFVHKHDPQEACLIPYQIGAQKIHHVDSPTHMRFGAWRSVDHSQHGFFIESFIDELAYETGRDPYELRRDLLKGNKRLLDVLDAAARNANWGQPSAEKGIGKGIAIVDSFGTAVAQVAEVDMRDGSAKVRKVWCVADPGLALSPDGFNAQMESGIVYGLTAALYGEISLKDGAVEQSNFHDYKAVRIDEAPEIYVEVINSGGAIGGGGEPSTPPLAAAVTNAIFAATGQRIRELPISKFVDAQGG